MEELNLVRDNERVDDLQVGGLKIIQNPEGFCFGIDAVLISNFAKVKRNADVVELGTGTGIIPLLIAGKTKAKKITAFEIQKEVADMADRSVKLNNLDDKIKIINDDLKNVLKYVPKASKDVVISNPPYVQTNGGLLNPKDKKAISRHEVACVLEDVVKAAANVLNVGGSFYMVHRPQRLVDIVYLMRKYNLEPKEIRLVQPKASKKPNIILVKGVRGGNPELKFLDSLIVYNEDGTYTDEIYDIYSEAKIDVFDGR